MTSETLVTARRLQLTTNVCALMVGAIPRLGNTTHLLRRGMSLARLRDVCVLPRPPPPLSLRVGALRPRQDSNQPRTARPASRALDVSHMNLVPTLSKWSD
jgi:hypothetical protein